MLARMALVEERFRVNMKSRREELGMSQTALANEMRDLEFAFHQQTVQRVESGERPIRLDESYAIAAILETTVERLLAEPVTASAFALAGRIAERRATLRKQFDQDLEDRIDLAALLDHVPEATWSGRLSLLGESWVDEPIEQVVLGWRKEREADSARERVLSGDTADDVAAGHARQSGTWIERLNIAEGTLHKEE